MTSCTSFSAREMAFYVPRSPGCLLVATSVPNPPLLYLSWPHGSRPNYQVYAPLEPHPLGVAPVGHLVDPILDENVNQSFASAVGVLWVTHNVVAHLHSSCLGWPYRWDMDKAYWGSSFTVTGKPLYRLCLAWGVGGLIWSQLIYLKKAEYVHLNMSVVATFFWFNINHLNLPYLQPQCLSLKDFFQNCCSLCCEISTSTCNNKIKLLGKGIQIYML